MRCTIIGNGFVSAIIVLFVTFTANILKIINLFIPLIMTLMYVEIKLWRGLR